MIGKRNVRCAKEPQNRREWGGTNVQPDENTCLQLVVSVGGIG